jgi:hypothetical protein
MRTALELPLRNRRVVALAGVDGRVHVGPQRPQRSGRAIGQQARSSGESRSSRRFVLLALEPTGTAVNIGRGSPSLQRGAAVAKP